MATKEVLAARRVRRQAAREERRSVPAPTAVQQPGQPPKVSSSPWILDRWRDLLLFVATPLVLIPVFAAAQARWSAQDIFLFVGAFGAMGHHLPGMIRAYSDRALFSRFKERFIIAPLLLVVVCVWSAFYNVQAVQLVALGWGIWHGMMQTYGFSRIYDAKASGTGASRARADLALCFAWFAAGVLLSPVRFRSFLDLYYESGGPLIPVVVIDVLRMALIGALVLVTIVFVWRQWSDWRQGRGASLVKIALLTTSIGFWWYCNVGVQNILVGIALFEVFHDVQYLAIVWIYNRSRVERDQTIGGFMRFVFRRSGALIGVYVGLVLAYGSIGLASSALAVEWTRHILLGVVTASALLHFYYDGFIWKVRETQTRNMLGIGGSGAAGPTRGKTWPLWAGHSLRWVALIIPVGALCAAQMVGRVVPPLERFGKTAEVLPNDAKAQLNYGKALHEAGRAEDAIPLYEKAASLKPDLAEAQFFLGLAWSDLSDLDRAVKYYEQAVLLDPKNVRTETNLANVLVQKGMPAEARRRYEHALSVDPGLVLAHKSLADILLDAGEHKAAIAHYEEALRLNPTVPGAKDNLSFARSLVDK